MNRAANSRLLPGMGALTIVLLCFFGSFIAPTTAYATSTYSYPINNWTCTAGTITNPTTLGAAEPACEAKDPTITFCGWVDGTGDTNGSHYLEKGYSSGGNCTTGGVTLQLTGSCSNGGSLSTTYPGWCIVGGQPPPSTACQSKTGQTVALESSTGHIAPGPHMDGESCNIANVADDTCATYQTSTVCVSFGVYDGTIGPQGTDVPTKVGSSDQCGTAGNGTSICGNANTPGQCGSVDGGYVCPALIPADTCVNGANGSSFCAIGTTSPPAPNNGTTGTPFTPSNTISSDSGGSQTGNVDYCNTACQNLSTITPTYTGGTAGNTPPAIASTACPAQECALLTDIKNNTGSLKTYAQSSASSLKSIAAWGTTNVNVSAANATYANGTTSMIGSLTATLPSMTNPASPDMSVPAQDCVDPTFNLNISNGHQSTTAGTSNFHICSGVGTSGINIVNIIAPLIELLCGGLFIIWLYEVLTGTGLFGSKR